MVRLWHLDLRSDDWTEARVLAPDAIAAGEAFLSYVAWVYEDFGDPPTLEMRAVAEVDLGSAQVVDLHMRDPGVNGTGAGEDGPKLWKVTYRDGLHHRPEGAALVVAESASQARALVEAADPFEGRPFYGVPAVYDRAEPFVPEHPYVLP
jgi:hypothetical protein